MIIIKKPHIEIRDESYVLISKICSTKENINEEIWYKTTKEYAEFLVDEVADAFVLPMLLVALRNQEDIKIEAPISEKLYYNIKNNILYTLSIPLNVNHKLNVYCDEYITPSFHPTGVGCGCSLGVDSFSAMIGHMSSECPKGFRITHLTNFNVGAYGNDYETATTFYQEVLPDVKKYAELNDIPLVLLESNFGIYFKGVNFNWCGPIRTMAAALSLQKLFRRYYYASGSANKDFKYSQTMSDFVSLIVPLLSTDNTELLVVDQNKNRIEKTIAIADNENVHKYLDVCWKRVQACNRGRTDLLSYNFRNCTRCNKCLRTLLTIDVLGKTEKFKEIFDIEYFNQHKREILLDLVENKNQDHYRHELFEFMLERRYPLPDINKKRILYNWLKSIISRIKSL